MGSSGILNSLCVDTVVLLATYVLILSVCVDLCAVFLYVVLCTIEIDTPYTYWNKLTDAVRVRGL